MEAELTVDYGLFVARNGQSKPSCCGNQGEGDLNSAGLLNQAPASAVGLARRLRKYS